MNTRSESGSFRSTRTGAPNPSTSSPSRRGISPFTLAVLAFSCYLAGAAFLVGSQAMQAQDRELASSWGQELPEEVRLTEIRPARGPSAAHVSRSAPSIETAAQAGRTTNIIRATVRTANGVYISDAGSPVDGRVYPNHPTGRTRQEPQRDADVH